MLLLALALFGWTRSMDAQIGGAGSINGTVTDSTGAVVAGATVTATQTSTGLQTTRATTSSGYYVLSPLHAGEYNVTVTAPGFETHTQEHVRVDAIQVVGLNMILNVGKTTESVTISSAPPQLDTTNATLGGTIENESYTQLPLQINGGPRNPTAFVYLMPGVAHGGNGVQTGIFNGTGSQGRLDEIYIDGFPQTSIYEQGDPRFVSNVISVEAVNQFQVVTSAPPAEYQGAGFENYVVKQGTNDFHGSVFEYFRNTSLDTWGFFAPAVINKVTGKATKPVEHQNEYGATLGGPIKKDRIFFFGAYDGYRFNKAGNPAAYTIPTMLMRQGNFSELPASQIIYDPATTACTNGVCTRQQATFNGIANAFDPARIGGPEQFMQKFLPQPTNSAIANNILGQVPSNTFMWDTTDRLDFKLTDKQQMSVTFGAQKTGVFGYLGFGSTVPVPYAQAISYAVKNKLLILEHTDTLTPHLVNQFKYGFSRFWGPVLSPAYNPAFAASAAGITGLPPGQASGAFPTVQWGGPNAISEWSGDQAYNSIQNIFALLDNVQYVHGKHSFTFGGVHEWLEVNNQAFTGGSSALQLNYNNAQTAGYAPNGALITTTGNSYASFLLSQVNAASLTQESFNTTGARIQPTSLYVQDDYSVTPKITVNIGLRWDFFPPFHEVLNRFSFLNPSVKNPITGNLGALQFAGSGPESCNCSTPIRNWYKNFGPRIGFAYSATSKTVLRGGYAISYTHGTGYRNATFLGTGQLGFSASPFVASSGSTGLPAFILDQGFPAYTPPPSINGGYGTGFTTEVKTAPTSISYGDPYLGSRAPYAINWNIGFERKLTDAMVIGVNYRTAKTERG